MTDTPILRAAQTRDVELDGRRYTLRALTYGEHADLQVARAERPAPGAELIDHTLAEACRAGGREDLAEAIVALHDAEDDLAAFYDSAPPILDEAGRAAWWTEKADELRALRLAANKLRRKRALAMELFGASPGVARLRKEAADSLRGAALDLILAGVVAIDGAPVTLTRDAAADLPSAHVAALSTAIGDMLSPSRDAAKN